MSQHVRVAFRAATICALLVVLAGCGGTTRNNAAVSGEPGATLIRAGALAYVSIDSDLDSQQWQKVDRLLRKFPGRDRWLAQLRRELAKQKLDYERDIAPALGPEVDIAVVAGASTEDIAYAWLTKPESPAKAEALAQKLGATSDPPEKTVARVVDGWVVVSSSREKIDRTLKPQGGDSLADDATFKAATADLTDDAIAKAYLNGRQFADLLTKYLRGSQLASAGGSAPFGLDKLDWISASLAAQDDGVRFEAGVKGGGDLTGTAAPYASKLIDGVPADALAFATYRGEDTAQQLRQLRQNPQFGPVLDAFERATGLTVDEVAALFGNEVAFYVRRGAGLPEFSLVLEQPQTEKALATLDRLAAKVATLTGAQIQIDQRDGLTVKSLTVGSVTVEWAGVDGRVLVTTGPTGIVDYRSDGKKLSDDARYKDALAAAGVPEKTSGLLFVDLHETIGLVEAYLGLSGTEVPADVRANLKPLQALVAYSTRSGDETKIAAFLELK